MRLEGRRIAVLVENQYEDLELWYPVLRLRDEGAQVTLVGPRKGEHFTGKHGLPAVADAAADEVGGADFDAIVVPGGYSPDMMRRHESMVRLLREIHDSGKTVAAICHAGWMLASSGIVRDRRLTSFFSIKDDMVNAGANWVDEPVVEDGNLVTSRFPADLPVFCRTIIAALEKAPVGAGGDGHR